MRRFLLQSLILILAASGIACACPVDTVAADTAPHEMHAVGTSDAANDCCEDCDDAAAMHPESLPVVIDIRFLQDDVDPAPDLLPVAIDMDWFGDAMPDRSPPESSQHLPVPTPVMRHDRMLD